MFFHIKFKLFSALKNLHKGSTVMTVFNKKAYIQCKFVPVHATVTWRCKSTAPLTLNLDNIWRVSGCCITGTQGKGELMGPTAGLDIVERKNILQNQTIPWSSSQQPSHYTKYAIRKLHFINILLLQQKLH